MLSTIDKFIGSILGAYCGQSYASLIDVQDTGPNSIENLPHPDPSVDLLGVSGTALTLPPDSDCLKPQGCLKLLPWLLRHHDNYRIRHQQIAQAQSSMNASTAVESPMVKMHVLYLLGDCLEWFMHTLPNMPQARHQLWEYLQCQRVYYPPELGTQMSTLLSYISDEKCEIHCRKLSDDVDPLVSVMLAVRQCLHYRENLILALSAHPLKAPMPEIVGTLLGAWGSVAVVPDQWMLAVPADVMSHLLAEAEGVYRLWAGVTDNAEGFEAFALDF